jgi:D-alanyl-D-alanine carboxypeptidase
MRNVTVLSALFAAGTIAQVQPGQIQPAQVPAPKMTASQAEAARAGAPFRQFLAFLEAYNSGDRGRLTQFRDANYRTMNLDAQMSSREQSGGLELIGLDKATDTRVQGYVLERDTSQFGLFAMEVEPGEPHRVTRFAILPVRRPPEYSVVKMTEAEVVSALRAKMDKDAAAGRFAGTVLLAKNGKVLFSGAYGMADREKKTPNTLDTKFRIGSMNKMFTATSVLQLVQAGKIKLTDPLGKYITDYPNQDVATKVTIHQLLTHTGGTGDIFGPEFTAHRLEIKTLNDYISLFGKRAAEFEPGSRWVYSNYGMVLAGVVIERVSGQNYYDYVDEHIYKPAGMTRSGSPPESESATGRSVGYTRAKQSGAWIPNTDTLPYRASSAGGGLSTVGDLLKFAEALMGHKLLNADYTDLLITGKVNTSGGGRYAYGFEDGRKDGVGAVGHSGGAPGMSGDLRIYIPSGYAIAVLSNLDPPTAPQVSAFLDVRLPD